MILGAVTRKVFKIVSGQYGTEAITVIKFEIQGQGFCDLVDWIALDWTATKANPSRKCAGDARFNQNTPWKARQGKDQLQSLYLTDPV